MELKAPEEIRYNKWCGNEERYDAKRLKLINFLTQRDGRSCGICGEIVAEGEHSIDHIWPQSKTKGMSDRHHADNLQMVHKSCNRVRQDHNLPFMKHISEFEVPELTDCAICSKSVQCDDPWKGTYRKLIMWIGRPSWVHGHCVPNQRKYFKSLNTTDPVIKKCKLQKAAEGRVCSGCSSEFEGRIHIIKEIKDHFWCSICASEVGAIRKVFKAARKPGQSLASIVQHNTGVGVTKENLTPVYVNQS